MTWCVLTPASRIVCVSALDARATARRESVGSSADVMLLGDLYDCQMARFIDGREVIPRRHGSPIGVALRSALADFGGAA
jgi:hypothetical protein